MGVSGSGKSTVGAALAARLGLPYADGDDLHPAANVAAMAAGHPLTEPQRAPWLRAVGAWLAEHDAGGAVVACSALRRAHRDLLRGHAPRVRFVHLSASRDVLATRLADRVGHFMPPGLLDSQLETLEPPAPDEPAVAVDVSGPPDAAERDALDRLGLLAALDRR